MGIETLKLFSALLNAVAEVCHAGKRGSWEVGSEYGGCEVLIVCALFLRLGEKHTMATVALGLFNSNSMGLGIGDLMIYTVAGAAAYAVTDYAFPNEGTIEHSISTTLGGIPIIGSFWAGVEDVDTLGKTLTSLSPIVGLVAGTLAAALTKDSSLGLLTAMTAGSLEALYLNGTFSELVPVL